MNYKIERKLLNNMALTEEEVNMFLSFICDEIRKNNQIYDPMDSNCKECDETSKLFGRIMLLRFGCDVNLIDIQKLLQIPLTHYANIVSFNVNGFKQTYLVDMTYSQFFSDYIVLDRDKVKEKPIVSTKKVFGKIKNEDFVIQLRKNGFVKLSDNVIKQYFDAFLNLCGVKNSSLAYDNINNLFKISKIGISMKR